jgi:hypothetical protein
MEDCLYLKVLALFLAKLFEVPHKPSVVFWEILPWPNKA